LISSEKPQYCNKGIIASPQYIVACFSVAVLQQMALIGIARFGSSELKPLTRTMRQVLPLPASVLMVVEIVIGIDSVARCK
jgi:uncharacterized membrane protein